MRFRRPTYRFLVAVTLLLVTTTSLTGCLRLPEEGPVLTSDQAPAEVEPAGPVIEPAPPAPGESPAEIVRHFLDAMTATSLQTNVARQFLTREAAASWNPEARTLTYAEAASPEGPGPVTVALTGVSTLDARGSWLGRSDGTTLSFPIGIEDGEYRISDVPDALIVPERWFAQRFRQISLYFFDPSGTILVPEPVYVPRGDQFATSAVRALLAGPTQPDGGEGQVIRTYAPGGLSVELSVVVDQEGLARIALQGDPDTLDPQLLPLFVAQLAWTLRQDPQIRFLSLNVDGRPINLPDGGARLSVDYGRQYDPTVPDASSLLFGLRDGVLVRATPGADETLTGPLGRTAYGVRDVSVDFIADRVAAVTSEGSRVLMTAVAEPSASVEEVISGGTNLAKPAWDAQGGLWVLDRRRSGARIAVVTPDSVAPVVLPGVTGTAARRLLVSRDGSRYAAVVQADGVDSVVVGRIVRTAEGVALRGVSAGVIYPAIGESGLPISSIGWMGPTRLALVLRVTEDRDQIRVISVDGGPAGAELPGSSRLVGTKVARLVTSPKSGAPVYVRTAFGLETPFERELLAAVDDNLTALTYVG